MSSSALCFRALVGAALCAVGTATSSGQTATTDPVGFYTLPATGGADNVLSVPLHRDAVFVGTITAFTANTLTVAAGAASPGWTVGQFTYDAAARPETYLAEITSGNLRGAFYKVTANGSNTLTLDTEGDDLTSHPAGALQANDSVRVRPYWRIRDIFETNGAPIIEARPAPGFRAKDDIIIPSYGSGATQTPVTILHYFEGWKASRPLATEARDFPLQPNTSLILRRRNPNPLNLVNLGNVAMTRNVSYVPGGDGTAPSSTYLALAHAAPVTLDASGLYNSANPAASVIKPATTEAAGSRDELLEFDNSTPGFNKSPSATYYYKAGEGWKTSAGALVGATKLLEPGKGYVVRKLATNPGVDWVKDPNY